VIEPRPVSGVRALVEGPVNIPMKGVDDAARACRQAGIDEVWLLTSSDVSEHPGVDRVLSQIPMPEVGAVYRSCDVLVEATAPHRFAMPRRCRRASGRVPAGRRLRGLTGMLRVRGSRSSQA